MKEKEKTSSQQIEQVEDLFFKIVEKPKNFYDLKIYNVFDNRYRINLWINVKENGYDKSKIHSSYFTRLSDNQLYIIM